MRLFIWIAYLLTAFAATLAILWAGDFGTAVFNTVLGWIGGVLFMLIFFRQERR